MKKVFAILYEPATYTIDRNRAVYDRLGVRYSYIFATSLAKAENTGDIDVLPSSCYRLWKRLKEILQKNDVIIMNGYTGKVFRILYLLNLWYRKPVGIDSDTQLMIPVNPIKRLIKYIYLKTVFSNKCYYGLPGGTKTHKELFRYFGMGEERIFLSPMMVDNNKFGYKGIRISDVFRFLFVGRIIEVKNIELMIKAFLKSYDGNPKVQLHIVGKGELLDKYQKQFAENKNVVFDGPKYGTDLLDAYKQASVFVLPSSYEPWGLVVNEAMSAGLPCIVSDKVGAAWDLVESKDTGFIFKFDDIDDLSSKMKTLVDDTSLYHRFAENAYNLMHNQWNYELYTNCLKDFIEKVKK